MSTTHLTAPPPFLRLPVLWEFLSSNPSITNPNVGISPRKTPDLTHKRGVFRQGLSCPPCSVGLPFVRRDPLIHTAVGIPRPVHRALAMDTVCCSMAFRKPERKRRAGNSSHPPEVRKNPRQGTFNMAGLVLTRQLGGTWCASKIWSQHGILVNGNVDQNPRSPGGLILTHTHLKHGLFHQNKGKPPFTSNVQVYNIPDQSLRGKGVDCSVNGRRHLSRRSTPRPKGLPFHSSIQGPFGRLSHRETDMPTTRSVVLDPPGLQQALLIRAHLVELVHAAQAVVCQDPRWRRTRRPLIFI